MWDKFVDFLSVVWVGVFVFGWVSPEWGGFCDNVNLGLLGVFVADLGVQYWRVRDWKRFLRHHWLTIFMVIPYFRVFRVLRLVKVLRMARLAKLPRVKGLESARRKVWRLGRRYGVTLKKP